MRVLRIGVLTVAAAWLFLACASQPSGPTGSVVGIAVDPTGHSVPGVTVTSQSAEGKNVDTVLTGADGSFSFPAVPPGTYRVLTLFQGFTARPPLPATVVAGQNVQLKPLVLAPPDSPAGGSGGSTPAISFVTPTPSAR